MKSNMSPRFSFYDFCDAGVRNPVEQCEIIIAVASCRVSPSKLDNFFRGNFSVGIQLSLILKFSALVVHVLNVFALCSCPQMVGVAASAGVNTRMQNIESFGDGLFVGNNPCQLVTDKVILLSRPSKPDLAIATGFAFLPEPAFIGSADCNAGPKVICEFGRQELREDFGRDNLCLHKLVLCHALGCANSARALLF
jgi:hypothetical protein